ncbi:MAG TPA: M14 family zinc carboxypeptidase [Bryobacteraceae bacterium]|nr:M14 family zinc carboxypeptidase [Bryobacteraceae bacterium]
MQRNSMLRLLPCALAFACLASAQQMDPDFAKSQKEWTTRPEFSSPLVDHLPKSTTVPSPKDVLGYYVGAPKHLSYYGDLVKYYRALAEKSPRVKVIDIGKTDEGRECIMVFVGSEDSIANLETYRKYLAQLADPRGLSEAQAQEIIAKAKPIYTAMGGLHSGETGPSEMLMELAYRLATEDTPIIKGIRDHIIVSIYPAADPDGRDRYCDWYYRYKINETGEQDNMGGPPYWGKYIFHDDNRDINYSQMPMRNLLAWYLEWHPPIMHELHESEPFMYTFSGQAPQNPTLDPILYGELPWFSNFEMAQMIKYGMPGVWTHAFVDMWSPGYLGFMSSNHNGMLRMYETFGNGGANTMHRRINAGGPGGGGPPPGLERGGGPTDREWYRPLPPYKETDWSMRNNTNYMETGVLSALQMTSAFPQVVLDNFYRKSKNSVEAGKKDAPYGYVIPGDQADPTRIAFVVNILRLQGIEVGRATGEIKLKEGTFPAGSFVVKRDQPYGRLAKILLEKQVYPDPALRTYDDAAWTMGLMTHTKVVESADLKVLDVPVNKVDRFEPKGNVAGEAGSGYAVLDNGSADMVTLRWRLKDVPVKIAEQQFKAGNHDIPAGSFVVPADAGDKLKSAIEPLGLTAVGLTAAPNVKMHDANLPRVAIYSTWGSTQDVGWVRYAFDHYDVPFDLIFKERVKQGDLRSAYDVIVVPNQARSAKQLVFDIEPKKIPLAYTKTDKFKYLGDYGSSPDITGGMGLEGVVELEKFVGKGGVLITLGVASSFPAEFGITRRVEAARTSPQFYAPGPIVQAEVLKPQHPIFYGYTEKTMPVRWASGPLLTVPQTDRDEILMRFPGGDDSVLSGIMKGANEIRNRPAIVDVPVGEGRVVLFATNPCYRWQNLGEFRMLFNALLNFDDMPSKSGGNKQPISSESNQ